ncbi:MAG: substrate-binding domain-containing protein [Terriglobales bacterium]
MEVQNKLAQFRLKRGISASRLASLIGVSRQTIYAIESSSYVPNTAVGLKLARALDVPLEDIFQLERDTPHPPHTEEVMLLPEDDTPHAGQPLRLCRVNGRLVATVPESGTLGLPPIDAVLVEEAGKGKSASAKAKVLEDGWQQDNRLLIAGCDPSAALVAHHLQRKGFELIITYQNSSRSLELLKQGFVHMAGTHLLDKKTGESNLPKVVQMFGKNSVAVIAFAVWEEGIVVGHGNPKNIAGIADFARRDVRITNREAGAGCRFLLDSLLQNLGIGTDAVKGYDRIALGHLPAARQVQSGESDCCISTRAAAQVFALDFIPLTTKRYDLVVRRNHLKLPYVQALIEMLGKTSFRRELESATSYDMHAAGDRIL